MLSFIDLIHKKSRYKSQPHLTVETVSVESLESYSATFTGSVTNTGNDAITQVGFIYQIDAPTIPDGITIVATFTGANIPFTLTENIDAGDEYIYAKAFATNSFGTVYGDTQQAQIQLCLAEGTLITLHNRSTKPIEDITYDNGTFATAKPLWIKYAETAWSYNVLKFSDGLIIRTIGQHRIYTETIGHIL